MSHHTNHLMAGWDCHVHLFDPAHPAQAGHYLPVRRDLPEIEQAATSLGMDHLVLVQPSVYGTDNGLILRALALAPRLQERDWHVQWYAQADQLTAIAELHEGSGLTAVLDHLAGLHAGIGAGDPAWSALQRLADQGAWVKLSGWYRLQASAPYEALQARIQRVAQLMGERLVWGSDWPHTAFDHDALPPYASIWQPVLQALGETRAAAVRAAGALLYA